MSEFEDIQKLIRLKRFEQPPEGYFENFVEEFHGRQRSELLNRSAHGLFMERVATYFSGFGKGRWMYATGGAMAAALIVFSLIPRGAQPVTQPGGSTGLTKVSSLMDDSNFHLIDRADESALPRLEELDSMRVLREGRASASERISRDLEPKPERKQPELFDRDVRIIEF